MATRMVRLEMAVDDNTEEIRDLKKSISGRTAFWSGVVARVLEPATLRLLVALVLGVIIILAGGSVAFGDWLQLGTQAPEQAQEVTP